MADFAFADCLDEAEAVDNPTPPPTTISVANDAVEVKVGASITVNPTANDSASDGTALFLDSVGTPPDGYGSVSKLDNVITVTAPAVNPPAGAESYDLNYEEHSGSGTVARGIITVRLIRDDTGGEPPPPTGFNLPTQQPFAGTEYFVSQNGSGISTDRSSPGAVAGTMTGVNDGSKVTVIGDLTAQVSPGKPKQTGRIWLRGSIPPFKQALDNRLRQSININTIITDVCGTLPTNATKIKAGIHLTDYRGCRVSDFLGDTPKSVIFITNSSVVSGNQQWITGNRLVNGSGNNFHWIKPDVAVMFGNTVFADITTDVAIGGTRTNWESDYGLSFYTANKAYIINNAFFGGFNQTSSLKEYVKQSWFENNTYALGPQLVNGWPKSGSAQCCVLGQESDVDHADRTCGEAMLRYNTYYGPRAKGFQPGNIVTVNVRSCNFLQVALIGEMDYYVGNVKDPHKATMDGPNYGKLVDVRDCTFFTKAGFRAMCRGRTGDEFYAEHNDARAGLCPVTKVTGQRESYTGGNTTAAPNVRFGANPGFVLA